MNIFIEKKNNGFVIKKFDKKTNKTYGFKTTTPLFEKIEYIEFARKQHAEIAVKAILLKNTPKLWTEL